MKKEFLPAYLALVFICLTWGTTYLVMRIGVMDIPPFLFASIRQILAGALLTGVMLTIGRSKFPSKKELWQLAVSGLLLFALANGLISWAQLYIPSGLAAIICSFLPMWIIFLNMYVNREERPNLPIVIGAILGLLGIVIIFGENLENLSSSGYLAGVVLTFVATFCWSVGSMWVKKASLQTDLFLTAGLQMFFGGLWLIPFSIVFDDYSTIAWSPKGAVSLVYLVVVGSILSYMCYYYALKKLPITMVSMYSYINPLVAVFLGWLVLDEKLNMAIGIGFVTTILGIYLVSRGYQIRATWRTQVSGD